MEEGNFVMDLNKNVFVVFGMKDHDNVRVHNLANGEVKVVEKDELVVVEFKDVKHLVFGVL